MSSGEGGWVGRERGGCPGDWRIGQERRSERAWRTCAWLAPHPPPVPPAVHAVCLPPAGCVVSSLGGSGRGRAVEDGEDAPVERASDQPEATRERGVAQGRARESVSVSRRAVLDGGSLTLDDTDELPGDAGPPRPRTWQVLGLLVGAAAVLSFLGSYAVSDVLVKAEVIGRWSVEADPRPRWMAVGFCILLAMFGALGVVARLMSRRQLKAIDAMIEAEG